MESGSQDCGRIKGMKNTVVSVLGMSTVGIVVRTVSVSTVVSICRGCMELRERSMV